MNSDEGDREEDNVIHDGIRSKDKAVAVREKSFLKGINRCRFYGGHTSLLLTYIGMCC